MNSIQNFFNSILQQIPDIIYAIILLIVAFIVAGIVKNLVVKLLKAVNAEEFLGKLGVKDTSTGSSIAFVAKLAYFITFLLFLPGVLDKLGMYSVSTPITNMVNSFLAFIPNLVGAGIIVAVGLFIAKIIKELLVPVLKAIKVDALQDKAGIESSEATSFSTIIANVIYAVIVLVVITAALDQLGIAAISKPANTIVNVIFAAIPNVLEAIIIIAVGVFIAKLVAKLLETVLAGVGADSLIEKITGTPAKKVVLSKAIGTVVQYVLAIIFIVQGINVLNLPVLTGIGTAVIGYMPAVLAAVIIIAIGAFAAEMAKNAILKKFPEAKGGALAVKTAIYVLVAFLGLSQLGVANAIVETTFILIVAAVCVAFAIAFGVGGRKFAADTLDELEKKINEKK
jgi:hypothetical protein